jgi:hypothetical protein
MKLRSTLGTLLLGLAITAWLSTAYAQQEDEACRTACQTQHEQCIESCAEHPDPVECDADCRDEMEDCNIECR